MIDLKEVTGRRSAIGAEAMIVFQAIGNPRVRNLVRGVLAARTDANFVKTMASLHRECGAEDAAAVGNILQASVLARYSASAMAFPEAASPKSEMPFYSATRFDLELAIQQYRLVQDEERLLGAIDVVGRTNQALLACDGPEAERLFALFRSDYGTSAMMALKAISMRNAAASERAGRLNDASVLDPFRRPRRVIVTSAFDDTSDLDRDYMKLRRFYVGVASNGRLHPADGALVTDLLSPLDGDGVDLAGRLEAFGRGGLLDLVAFLFRAEAILARLGRDLDLAAVRAAIPATVRAAWSDAFAGIDLASLQDFVGREDQFHDLACFAHLPAWSECPSIFAHRLDVEADIGRRLDGRLAVPSRGPRPAPTRRSVPEIASFPADAAEHALEGGFARTIALLSAVAAGGVEVPSGEELLVLLDRTINVPLLLSVEEIEAFLPRRRDDALYEYLRTALLNDADGGALRDHELRRAVERLLKERFDGEVLKLMEFVDSDDGHVSQHLFQMCSETFLSDLYGTYRLADDVMEAQTRLLEWQGDRRDDEDLKLRAKSLRLLIRLRKVRGSIEETRIYVDPLRLLEWLHENVEEEIRALQPLADEILAMDGVDFNAADTVANSVQPRSRLLSVIDRAYHEFSANKVHGAASYIARRVRHGKFYGHLAVEMKSMVDAAVAEFATCHPDFADYLRRWYRDLDRTTHEFARERIHIRSKARPRGLIVATIEDPEKLPVLRIAVEEVGQALRNGVAATQAIALILDYCWLLIEVDLKRARAAIEDLRRDFVVDAAQNLIGRPEVDARVTETVRAVNAELGRRFEAAKSWLTRRSNASPSASVELMVNAVLDEVSESFEFRSDVEFPADLSLDLIGHRFHFFYDSLWILVTNAAAYGLRDAGLVVAVRTSVEPDGRHVNMAVEVVSRFAPGMQEAQTAAIDDRMTADIGDAMERDGGTGLRKLRSLVQEAKEVVGFDRFYEGDSVRFVIRSRYPLS